LNTTTEVLGLGPKIGGLKRNNFSLLHEISKFYFFKGQSLTFVSSRAKTYHSDHFDPGAEFCDHHGLVCALPTAKRPKNEGNWFFSSLQNKLETISPNGLSGTGETIDVADLQLF
jgi:hypothetical protein